MHVAEHPLLAALDLTLTPYRLHYHRRIARELSARLLTVHLRDRDHLDWSLSVPPELEVISLDDHASTGPLRAALVARRALHLLHSRRAQAAIVGGWGDLTRALIIVGCHRAGIPVLLFADSNSRAEAWGSPRTALKRAILAPLLRRCAAVLVCGSLGVEFFRAYGVPRERLFMTPYEPDYALFQSVPSIAVEGGRRRWGLPAGRSRLLFVGRLAREKRVDLLIDAFQLVSSRRSEWDLVIAGAGPEQARLMRRAQGSRVRFLGLIEPAQLPELYACCDALALPSDHEPWGVVVNEALAAGLALVCADRVGAAAELIRDGRNGRCFVAGSLPSLADALLEVTDPARLATFRAAAPAVLAEWRRTADPVAGLRAALASVGVAVGIVEHERTN